MECDGRSSRGPLTVPRSRGDGAAKDLNRHCIENETVSQLEAKWDVVGAIPAEEGTDYAEVKGVQRSAKSVQTTGSRHVTDWRPSLPTEPCTPFPATHDLLRATIATARAAERANAHHARST
jgi:hypothetical protein